MIMRYAIGLFLMIMVTATAAAADISPDDLVAAFCRFFATRDIEEAFRPISALAAARVSSASRKERDGRDSLTAYTTKLEVDKIWEVTYDYQKHGGRAEPYGFVLRVHAWKPERGLIFNSAGEMQEWLEQFGTVRQTKSITDKDVYTVDLQKVQRSGKPFTTATISAVFEKGSQRLQLTWLMPEHLSAARSICKQ